MRKAKIELYSAYLKETLSNANRLRFIKVGNQTKREFPSFVITQDFRRR